MINDQTIINFVIAYYGYIALGIGFVGFGVSVFKLEFSKYRS